MDTKRFRYRHIEDREIDELIGICRGILADGEVNLSEKIFLLNWLKRNTENLSRYPFFILHERLVDILCDCVIDDDEQLELIDLFLSIIGEPTTTINENPAAIHITSSPAKPYTIESIPCIKGKVFTLTGAFELAKRSDVVNIITLRGGLFSKGLTKKTEYLVIGKIGSEYWKHSSFGRKIEKAMEYKSNCLPIEVIGEEHLVIHFE